MINEKIHDYYYENFMKSKELYLKELIRIIVKFFQNKGVVFNQTVVYTEVFSVPFHTVVKQVKGAADKMENISDHGKQHQTEKSPGVLKRARLAFARHCANKCGKTDKALQNGYGQDCVPKNFTPGESKYSFNSVGLIIYRRFRGCIGGRFAAEFLPQCLCLL